LFKDVVIPSDRNVIQKEAENKSQYKNQVQRFSECGI